MKKLLILWIVVLIIVAALTSGCLRDKSSDTTTEKVAITTIRTYGKSVDWSHTLDLIATVKLGGDGYFDP